MAAAALPRGALACTALHLTGLARVGAVVLVPDSDGPQPADAAAVDLAALGLRAGLPDDGHSAWPRLAFSRAC